MMTITPAGGPAGMVEGVKVTEHTPEPFSVQLPALKLPEPVGDIDQLTLPVGVPGVPGSVSVTVAVQLVPTNALSGLGEHATATPECRAST